MLRPFKTIRLSSGSLYLGVFFAVVLLGAASGVLADTQSSKPDLTIPIPNMKPLSDLVDVKKNGNIWLAEYMFAWSQYLITVVGVLAAVMMMWGGFQTMVGQQDAGKKRIKNALVGMIIALGSYLILATVSPDTLKLKPLYVIPIDGEQMALDAAGGGDVDEITGAKPVASGLETVSTGGGKCAPASPAGTSGSSSGGSGGLGAETMAGGNFDDTCVPAGGAADGVPKQAASIPASDRVPDLYDPKNEYGTVVTGNSFPERMASICVGRLKNKGGSDRAAIIKRAAAITRVWLVEGVLRNGSTYSRGAGCATNYCGRLWLSSRAASCMRGVTPTLSEEAVKGCITREDRKFTPRTPVPDGTDCAEVKKALNVANKDCILCRVQCAKLYTNQCSGFASALAVCALGKNINPKPGTEDILYMPEERKDGARPSNSIWTAAFSAKGTSPQPFDYYHFGLYLRGITPIAANSSAHSALYIGGLGLRFGGQEIGWVEMGGSGSGQQSKPTVAGQKTKGMAFTLGTTISSFNYGGYWAGEHRVFQLLNK